MTSSIDATKPSATAPTLESVRDNFSAAKSEIEALQTAAAMFERVLGLIASTGSANAYVVTYTTAPGSYTTGHVYGFRANFANTGAATVNINSLGSKAIKRPDGSALEAGDIASGAMVLLGYDGTNMQLMTPPGAAVTQAAMDIALAGLAADFVNGNFNRLRVNPGDSGATISGGAQAAMESSSALSAVLGSADANEAAWIFSSPSKQRYAALKGYYNAGAWYVAMETNGSERLIAYDAKVAASVPVKLQAYTVADLTAMTGEEAGWTVYCSNGAAGSPCIAFYDGQWRRCDTLAAVST